jgi:hypothetical protein
MGEYRLLPCLQRCEAICPLLLSNRLNKVNMHRSIGIQTAVRKNGPYVLKKAAAGVEPTTDI